MIVLWSDGKFGQLVNRPPVYKPWLSSCQTDRPAFNYIKVKWSRLKIIRLTLLSKIYTTRVILPCKNLAHNYFMQLNSAHVLVAIEACMYGKA